MIDLEILANGPEGWTHVSTSMIDTPPTWLRYEVAGVYSVWMDDNGTNPNPFGEKCLITASNFQSLFVHVMI